MELIYLFSKERIARQLEKSSIFLNQFPGRLFSVFILQSNAKEKKRNEDRPHTKLPIPFDDYASHFSFLLLFPRPVSFEPFFGGKKIPRDMREKRRRKREKESGTQTHIFALSSVTKQEREKK